jgi:capsular polysaccharide biosynthesis protein
VSTSNAKTSKDVVDSTINSFKSEIKQLYGQDNTKLVDIANTPDQPDNVHKNTQLIIATMAGFIVAIVVVFFIYDFRLSSVKRNKNSTKKLIRKTAKIVTKLKKSTAKVTPKTSKTKSKTIKKK